MLWLCCARLCRVKLSCACVLVLVCLLEFVSVSVLALCDVVFFFVVLC